jgi:AcrR family transcriptional regulator
MSVTMPNLGSAGSTSERTRARVVASARSQFASDGYAGVSVADIALEAGVTKGAVYHHFATKKDLFLAALEDVEAEIQARSRQAAKGQRTPLARLQRGFGSYLDAVLDPEIGRISLIDAPAVLGAGKHLELSRRYAHDDVVFTLGVGLPEVDPDELDALSSTLLGAVTSAALVLISSPTPETTRVVVGDAMDRLLRGVLGPAVADNADRPGLA